jgi:hypothetical protein
LLAIPAPARRRPGLSFCGTAPTFLLVALLTVSGILVSLGLPNMLVPLNLGESAFEVEVQKAGSSLGQRSGL